MVKIINRDELMKMISSGENFKLADVLSKEHYADEHIKGAISLPLDEIQERAEQVLKKDEVIVVYCASFTCQASTLAAEKLLSLGYKSVLDYKGGLKDYKEANLALEGRLYEKKAKSVPTCTSC